MLPLIFAGVATLAGVSGAYLWQENRYERIIAEQRAVQATILAEANANAKREIERLQKAKDEALRAASIRQHALASDLAANRDALRMLSGAADSTIRAAQHSHGACLAAATAQGDVLNQCSARLVEVGTAADEHASDVQTLTEAWPNR